MPIFQPAMLVYQLVYVRSSRKIQDAIVVNERFMDPQAQTCHNSGVSLLQHASYIDDIYCPWFFDRGDMKSSNMEISITKEAKQL